MNFYRLLLGLVILFVACLGSAQSSYTPTRGETVLKLEIEGRGSLFIRLFTKEAPKATAHIIELVQRGFYDTKPFHRVERSPKPFLAQIGPTNSTEAADVRIPYEDSGFSFKEAGMVGLSAKPNDRDSGDCQFHILLGPATFLDGSYTCFGKVVFGADILGALKQGDKVKKASIVRG
ncbi:MAG: peptidylprolyl isomerase [Fimbriimonadaceae bacterium]